MPCPPEDVVTVLDCYSNTAQVEWQASSGADSYVVQAFGVEEHETNCSTDSQSCILPELLCGFTYNVSVIAVNNVCNVSQSEVQRLQAGKNGNKEKKFQTNMLCSCFFTWKIRPKEVDVSISVLEVACFYRLGEYAM